MKKIFKLTLSIVFLSLIISCDGEKQLSNEQENAKNYQKTFASNTNDLSHIPLISSTDENESALELIFENDFQTKEMSNQYGWEYFDKFHSQGLNSSEEQYVAYVVLKRKELITQLSIKPQDEDILNAFKRNIDILVNNKYLGYHLLYNALNVISTIDESYTKETARKIVAYSIDNEYVCNGYQELLNNSNIDDQTKESYSLWIENCKYADIIANSFL
ncbi:hypothetical protein [Avrilella dinanensis]|uniref:Lipoprotein n=1 Tax=Avrilella dinanensis TaxID=2008672 RepID=A0A2M9R4E2_9FLAO|nr:hypothetical protein [Avrilella dinanensis]PJR03750.1 hypothetical protein CDL10_03850 [Avrilella dinanensis]